MRHPRAATTLLVILAIATSACAIVSETVDPDAGDPQVSLQCAPGVPDCEDAAVIDSDDPMLEPEVTGTGPEATTTEMTGATLPEPSAGEAVVYLLEDSPTATGPSPSLIPMARPLAVLSYPVTDLARTTIEFLLAGPLPGEAEAIPAISTAIPDGTRLLDLTVADGVATIDLSAEFATGSGSFAEAARLEQVVFTLTRFDDIDGVEFRIDGSPVDVFGGHGIVLDHPAGRSDLATAIPVILIESPAYWGVTANPLVVSGTADVFEATLNLALVDGDGLILWEGTTTASCGTGCRGDWQVEIPYEIDEPQLGAIIAWETSAADGSQINVREHPVWLGG